MQTKNVTIIEYVSFVFDFFGMQYTHSVYSYSGPLNFARYARSGHMPLPERSIAHPFKHGCKELCMLRAREHMLTMHVTSFEIMTENWLNIKKKVNTFPVLTHAHHANAYNTLI